MKNIYPVYLFCLLFTISCEQPIPESTVCLIGFSSFSIDSSGNAAFEATTPNLEKSMITYLEQESEQFTKGNVYQINVLRDSEKDTVSRFFGMIKTITAKNSNTPSTKRVCSIPSFLKLISPPKKDSTSFYFDQLQNGYILFFQEGIGMWQQWMAFVLDDNEAWSDTITWVCPMEIQPEVAQKLHADSLSHYLKEGTLILYRYKGKRVGYVCL